MDGPAVDGRAADLREIAKTFDARAATYARDGWHLRCAERLVELCRLSPASHVLDAATGTGFAALAAARAVGPEGRVLGVDISREMLRTAGAALEAAGLQNVVFFQGDAVSLPQYADATFDAITCSSALFYMPAADALREWHRLLKPRGLVAFSTFHAGSPPPARLFRDCASAFGVSLRDPCEPLGSAVACRSALERAGFDVVDIVSEPVMFSAQDLAVAWESNIRAAAHSGVRRLDADRQADLKRAYLEALAREEADDPEAFSRAPMLYAIGRR
jgi:ubiquinone/menaquinone biosynthesis C-methylase UbiE